MRRRILTLTAVLLFSAAPPLLAFDALVETEPSRGTLEVRIKGLRSSTGKIALALFDDRESFDSRREPVRAAFVQLRRKKCKWVVEDLPAGIYALVAYHDKNDNGELDRRKMFGIPTEPYGFSNDARGKFGPPPFEDARFELGSGKNTITIRVH